MPPAHNSHSLSKTHTHVAAPFTTNQPEAHGFKICGCGHHCPTKLFPLTEKFYLIEDRKEEAPSIWVCHDCHGHYMSKADSVLIHKYFVLKFIFI